MQATETKITLTAMHREYLTQVLAIEKSNSQESNPLGGSWTKKDFLDVLAIPSHHGIVAWKGSKIVGFVIYCLSMDKIFVANLAVHADHLNEGIGSQLVMKLKSKLRPKRRVSLEIDIRESNLRAQLFLRGRGFKAVCVCRNWFEQPRKEDCYKFQYKLEEKLLPENPPKSHEID